MLDGFISHYPRWNISCGVNKMDKWCCGVTVVCHIVITLVVTAHAAPLPLAQIYKYKDVLGWMQFMCHCRAWKLIKLSKNAVVDQICIGWARTDTTVHMCCKLILSHWVCLALYCVFMASRFDSFAEQLMTHNWEFIISWKESNPRDFTVHFWFTGSYMDQW